MNANWLLFWMSARRQGSWQQFRTAIEELHVSTNGSLGGEADDVADQFSLPLYQELRFNLQRMGHAEFFSGAGDAEWRITPPSVAVAQHASGSFGILVGARSLALLQRLNAAAGVVSIQTVMLPGYPDQILLTGSDSVVIADVAKSVGLLMQNNAPATILTSLPPIDDPSVRNEMPFPFGAEWKVDRFSPTDLGWRSAGLGDATSAPGDLFRFSLRHQREVLFCAKGRAYKIPGQVGKYLALKRKGVRVLRYDVRTEQLSVQAICRPPFLIERALILCSGSPPTYEGGSSGGTLHYNAIPENIAVFTSGLLRQEFR
jgi:hypothetical protein